MPGAERAPLASEFLCVIDLDIAERVEITGLPSGTRRVVVIEGGRVEGERLHGAIVGPGAVFATIRPDGVLLNDARFVVRTDDGHEVHVHYEALMPPRAPDATEPYHLRSVVRFEAASPAYAWLDSRLGVGRAGSSARGPLSYEVFLLV